MEFGSDPPPNGDGPLPTSTEQQKYEVYSLGDGPFPSEGDPFPIKLSDFLEDSNRLHDRLKRQRNNRRDSAAGRSHLAAGSYGE